MNNNTTFWNYLKDNVIEIPIIQRDYAQGRLGKENLRKSFLGDLKNALDNGEIMKLDFVYGSTENDKLNPLDGQQRLTTLWLLHWYIALCAGMLSKDNCDIFRKFTYETRISSREFCDKLCVSEHFEKFREKEISIVDFITNQTWFYSAWKQDPTIQSMLRMLGGTKIADKNGDDIEDGIEEIFQRTSKDGFKSYWEKLTNEAIIVFYHLPLKDFGLSDDLYIKMNARGKQLTSFENFKADLIGYITKQSKEDDKEWKNLLNATEGIPIKMDTVWTDIFWNNHSTDNKIDEIYFAFLNRFFWNEFFTAKKENEYFLKIGQGKTNDGKEYRNIENTNKSYVYLNGDVISYSDLAPYKYLNNTIPLTLFTNLTLVLDRYRSTIPVCEWDKSFYFIPEYNKSEVTKLTQVHRIVFFALCKYYKEDEYDEISLNRWMRVVWNLVSGDSPDGNPQIRSTEAIRNAIKFVDELNSHSVYESLINYDTKKLKEFDFDKRCKEEIEKAKQILIEKKVLRKYEGSCKKEDGSDYNTWEEIIIDAEKFAFFKGAIRFLFTNGEGITNWDDFDTKWKNVQKYFDNNGIVDVYKEKAIILRVLFSRTDIAENWFGYYKDFWYTFLLNKDRQSAIHYLLTTPDLEIEKTCSEKWIIDDSLLQELLRCYDSWHILHGWRGYKVLTLYSQRRSDAVCDDQIVVLNTFRNVLLNKLLNEKKIEIENDSKVGETSYFYGWNINFIYRGDHFFQWYGNPNDIELDVYLMKENWSNYEERPNPTTDKGTDDDDYYCFRVNDKMTTKDFVVALENLIMQKEEYIGLNNSQ